MSNKRVSDLANVPDPRGEDFIHVVDVSNTTDNPAGSSRKLSITRLGNVIGGSQDIVTGNAVLKGGVIKTGAHSYTIWANRYIINNILYSELVTGSVTLTNGDATHGRIDVFYIEADGLTNPVVPTVGVTEGTPSATPVKPTLDLDKRVEVSFRITPATETTDTTTVEDLIYDENVGATTEYNNTDLATGGDLDDTDGAFSGSKCLSIPAITTSDTVAWQDTTTHVFNGANSLVFAVKFPEEIVARTLETPVQIKLVLSNSASSDSWRFTLNEANFADYGLNINSLAWQESQIPLSNFSANITQTGNAYDTLTISLFQTPALKFDKIRIQSILAQPLSIRESYQEGIGASAYTVLELTAAQVKAIGTTRVLLQPAPESGYVWDFETGFMTMTYGSAPFDANGLDIESEGGNKIGGTVVFLDDTANSDVKIVADGSTGNLYDGGAIYVTGTDSVATGDSPVIVYAKFNLVKLR